MSSLAVTALSLTLGLIFIFIGQFKVTPKFFPGIHKDMVKMNYLKMIKFSFSIIRNMNLDVSIKYFHCTEQQVGDHMLKIIE